MKLLVSYGVSVLVASIIVLGGVNLSRFFFADRVVPGVHLGTLPIGSVSFTDVPQILLAYEEALSHMGVELSLRGVNVTIELGGLGMFLDKAATYEQLRARRASRGSSVVRPYIKLNEQKARKAIEEAFRGVLALPRNAIVVLSPAGNLEVIKGMSGEHIDLLTLEQDLRLAVSYGQLSPLVLIPVAIPPAVMENEVYRARSFAEILLAKGFELTNGHNKHFIHPDVVKSLITFIEDDDPYQTGNRILGVAFDRDRLKEYLHSIVSPEIDEQAQNARFDVESDETGTTRVAQFALPTEGRSLDIEESAERIRASLRMNRHEAHLAVVTTKPNIEDLEQIQSHGIDSLLATGISDFAGSPKNRINNIQVGARRFHGLLVAPGEEFSFNKFLGSVSAEAGFKPELVIKHDKTIAEFGGGLCQVSTTAFRAAVQSGMNITQRRNHSYAVAYYGKPGFDATIYPPYTDFRFLNNTKSYILIQTKIVGTHLTFEFWGADDGRTVEVDGPHPYNRQDSGAVKSLLRQKVTRDGSVIIDDTFYSSYKSPALFPRA